MKQLETLASCQAVYNDVDGRTGVFLVCSKNQTQQCKLAENGRAVCGLTPVMSMEAIGAAPLSAARLRS